MNNYKDNIQKIISLIPSLKGNIFDYEDTPLEEELENIFQYYQDTLIHHYKYGTEPSYLFFDSTQTVNAKACKFKGAYLVGINIETFRWLKESSEKADVTLTLEFEKILDNLDNPIKDIFYDFALHFTFYHEQAHLIQKSQLLTEGLQEQPEKEDSFSLERHMLEIDADEFSALCLGSHILQYASNIFGNQPNKDQIEDLLVLGCSSVMLYFMSFPSNAKPIYYYESTHPHPAIRITGVVFTIVSYVTVSLKIKGIELAINPNDTVNRTISTVKEMANSIFDQNPIDIFWSTLEKEALKIIEYRNEVKQQMKDNKELSVYKWNQINK